jgi:fatty aldehyde-generating acyl-ACP reductase
MSLSFALLGHPTSYDHIASLLPMLRPDLEVEKVRAHKTALAKAFEWSSTFATEETLIVPIGNSAFRIGKLIICTFLPEHAHSPRQMSAAFQKTRDGVKLAKDLGAGIVGLGGFTSIVGGATSIVGGAQGEKLPAEFGLAATSGNSLTAALAIEQIKALSEKLDWPLAGQTVAVLGATGDIGKACAIGLGDMNVRRLILIARNKAKLASLRLELSGIAEEVFASTDPGDALRASLIIAATSSAAPLLNEADLLAGTIVCDIGYPNTLSPASDSRPEVLAFHGGLAQAPFELPITQYTLLPSPDVLPGCFAETLALVMANRYESYSIGQGRITPERMQTILDLAHSLGFRPATFYRNNNPVTDADLTAFVNHSASLRGR